MQVSPSCARQPPTSGLRNFLHPHDRRAPGKAQRAQATPCTFGRRLVLRRSPAGLAVQASSNYGAEWSTPQDAYLTVVRGWRGCLCTEGTQPGCRAGSPASGTPPPTAALHPSPQAQGLAHCYVKGEDGRLVDQFVIEPITANSLECMANGGSRGCGRHALAAALRLHRAVTLLPSVPRDWLAGLSRPLPPPLWQGPRPASRTCTG
jgi:hypothetical protein